MTRPALRSAAIPLMLLGVCACAHAAGRLPDLEADATPVAPPPAAHHFLPLFHHAAYLREAPLSSRSPIAVLCANAQAKAVLDQDLPGLTRRPEFEMFKHMSLRTLQHMSHGKLSVEDVAKVDTDLARIAPEGAEGGLPKTGPEPAEGGLQKVALRQ